MAGRDLFPNRSGHSSIKAGVWLGYNRPTHCFWLRRTPVDVKRCAAVVAAAECGTMSAAAKKLGVTDFVHISFPRHMSYELLSRRRKGS